MTCDDVRPLLHGYTDGELDLVRHVDVESHLENCSGCAGACEKLMALASALRNPSFRFEAPPTLRARIEASLGDQSPARRGRRTWLRPSLAVAALLLALAAGALVRFLFVRTRDDHIAQEVVASHVRSLMADHLADKRSDDRHQVKPWFQQQGKLDFSFPVPDLSEHGFALYGGRLDYVDNRRVAALVYQRRQHIINLLIWQGQRESESGPEALTRQGYQMFHWSQGGLVYWAVSDLNSAELRTFVELVRQQ